MSSGRTSWFGKDAGWWRRDYIIALVDQFGPAGPAVIDYICCECAAQDGYSQGTVKTNHRAIMRDTGVSLVTLLAILDAAVALGLLEDFERLTDHLFTCRISGWKSDRDKAMASVRKARSRASHETDTSNVTSHETAENSLQSKAKQSKAKPSIKEVFDAWIVSTKRTAATKMDAKRRGLIERALNDYPLQDVLDAVDGWRFSAHHRGDNSDGKAWNDLGLLLRDAAHIEQFRDYKRKGDSGASGSVPDSMLNPRSGY
jgi:hypothetical protein